MPIRQQSSSLADNRHRPARPLSPSQCMGAEGSEMDSSVSPVSRPLAS
jgi:hypothetical protein